METFHITNLHRRIDLYYLIDIRDGNRIGGLVETPEPLAETPGPLAETPEPLRAGGVGGCAGGVGGCAPSMANWLMGSIGPKPCS